ncbi:hypothetical protein YC2023_027875 [Brassica napus]
MLKEQCSRAAGPSAGPPTNLLPPNSLDGPDWFNRSGCGCGCRSLRMRVVAVSSGSERFGAVWSGLERFERLLQKRQQPLPTAKAAFAGGSGKTSHTLNVSQSCVMMVRSCYLSGTDGICVASET